MKFLNIVNKNINKDKTYSIANVYSQCLYHIQNICYYYYHHCFCLFHPGISYWSTNFSFRKKEFYISIDVIRKQPVQLEVSLHSGGNIFIDKVKVPHSKSFELTYPGEDDVKYELEVKGKYVKSKGSTRRRKKRRMRRTRRKRTRSIKSAKGEV